MGESSKCQTLLPRSSWADDAVQRSSDEFFTGQKNAASSQAPIDRSHCFGVPIIVYRKDPPLSTVEEEHTIAKYHKLSYIMLTKQDMG